MPTMSVAQSDWRIPNPRAPRARCGQSSRPVLHLGLILDVRPAASPRRQRQSGQNASQSVPAGSCSSRRHPRSRRKPFARKVPPPRRLPQSVGWSEAKPPEYQRRGVVASAAGMVVAVAVHNASRAAKGPTRQPSHEVGRCCLPHHLGDDLHLQLGLQLDFAAACPAPPAQSSPGPRRQHCRQRSFASARKPLDCQVQRACSRQQSHCRQRRHGGPVPGSKGLPASPPARATSACASAQQPRETASSAKRPPARRLLRAGASVPLRQQHSR
mmetsp:Transcript_175956/g.564201  ORF Transcript_175956/g.564201 Transcript_175956/m.564201 type:complete len:271 (-) Transcript_175956:954-1766(-)